MNCPICGEYHRPLGDDRGPSVCKCCWKAIFGCEAEAELRTTVVNLRKESYDVYIGRGSKWGNPFKLGNDGTRKEVIEKYRVWILQKPELLKELPKLQGKRLGCYCKPLACHGDVLLELLEDFGEFVRKGFVLNG